MGLFVEPFSKPIGSASSTRGQPSRGWERRDRQILSQKCLQNKGTKPGHASSIGSGWHNPCLWHNPCFWLSAAKKGLSGPVSRDTARLSQRYPPIARYGVFGVSIWPIGCDTPSTFSECSPPPLESMRSGVAIPPPQKGYLSDTCAIPYETRRTRAIPPLRYYLEYVLREKGGGYLALGH